MLVDLLCPRGVFGHVAELFCCVVPRSGPDHLDSKVCPQPATKKTGSLILSSPAPEGGCTSIVPLHFMPARGAASTARTAPSPTVLCDLHQFRPQPRSHAETRDRTGDLQIFSLTLSQLSYRGLEMRQQIWVCSYSAHNEDMPVDLLCP